VTLIVDHDRITSNVDRMAIEHLRQAGILVPRGPGRPKAPKKIAKARIGWRNLDPFKGSLCRQCGGRFGHERAEGSWPYAMVLCQHCASVHTRSLDAGLKPSQEVFW
jgi:hypothetical protein